MPGGRLFDNGRRPAAREPRRWRMRPERPLLALRTIDPGAYAEAYISWMRATQLRADDPIRRTTAEEVGSLVAGWIDPSRPLSRHLALAVTTVQHRGWRLGDAPVLTARQPVPGCNCADCTGREPLSHPRRRRPRRRRGPDGAQLNVEAARAVHILEVARRLGLPLRRVGSSHRGPCPIHRGSGPNFAIYPGSGRFHCYVCGATGDALQLVQDVRRCDFPTAVRTLAEVG